MINNSNTFEKYQMHLYRVLFKITKCITEFAFLRSKNMNKLEQDTLEIIEEYLPRIAVALEEIAKELKEQKAQKQYNAETLKQAMQMLKGE